MTTKLTAGVVLLAALAAASVAAGCSSTKSKAAQPRILRFLIVDRSFTPIGFGEKHVPAIGDRFLFTTSIYKSGVQPKRPSGTSVGRGESLCTVTAPGGAELYCTGLLYLPRGHLVLSDAVRGNARVNTGAIVGGVGAYATARGTAEFTVLRRQPNGVETTALVLRLTR